MRGTEEAQRDATVALAEGLDAHVLQLEDGGRRDADHEVGHAGRVVELELMAVQDAGGLVVDLGDVLDGKCSEGEASRTFLFTARMARRLGSLLEKTLANSLPFLDFFDSMGIGSRTMFSWAKRIS